jgi:modification methylase
VKVAESRIASLLPLSGGDMAVTQGKRGETRIPFGSLVESGLVRPGTRLIDPQRRHSAEVRADGSLSMGSKTGSIHQLGAAAQGLPSCNGWTFWHIEEAGKLVPLDAKRAVYRASVGAA